MPGRNNLKEVLEGFCKLCYENSKLHGFWEGIENDNIPTKIALMHSELSEMLEAHRGSNPPCDKPIDVNGVDGLKRITSMEEEVADLFIRLCDFCGRYNINLGEATIAKYNYNLNRPYRHGKTC